MREEALLTRLVHALRHEIVHHDTNEPIRSTEHQLLLAQRRSTSVNAGQDALRSRLFVACRAVDLAGEEETRDALCLERVCVHTDESQSTASLSGGPPARKTKEPLKTHA